MGSKFTDVNIEFQKLSSDCIHYLKQIDELASSNRLLEAALKDLGEERKVLKNALDMSHNEIALHVTKISVLEGKLNYANSIEKYSETPISTTTDEVFSTKEDCQKLNNAIIELISTQMTKQHTNLIQHNNYLQNEIDYALENNTVLKFKIKEIEALNTELNHEFARKILFEKEEAYKEGQRSLTGNYCLNDTIYIVGGEYRYINCEYCNEGNIEVIAKNNTRESIKCLKCKGEKHIRLWYKIPKSYRINKIIVTQGKTQLLYSLYLFNDSETPISTTTDEVFSTKEDCQKRCDELNKA